MISCLRRLSLLACAGALGATLAAPAQAVPLIGVEGSAAVYFDLIQQGNGGQVPAGSTGVTVEAGAAAFGMLDLSARYMTNFSTQANLVEGVLRTEISPLPMLSIKPGIGYQGQNVFATGFDHAPLAKVQAMFSPILSPIWAEAELSASYPLDRAQPVIGSTLGVNLAPLPFLSLGLRYLNYRELNAPNSPGDFGSLQIGLRATI